MAQLYSTGPAHIFVGANDSSPGQAKYLGTGEAPPKIEIDPKYKAILNDIGGNEVPIDLMYMNAQAFTFVTLNRYNESVYQMLANRPRIPNLNGAPIGQAGTQLFGDVGTLMNTEGKNFIVYVHFPFAAKAVMAGAAMTAGYRFPSSALRGPDKVEPGTMDKKKGLVFHHLPYYYPATQSFVLYDYNLKNLPNPD